MKKIFLSLGILVLSFSIFSYAQAATIQQLGDSVSDTLTGSGQNVGQTLGTGLSGTIDDFYIKGCSSGVNISNSANTGYLVWFSNADYAPAHQVGYVGSDDSINYLGAVNSVNACGDGPNLMHFHWNSPVTLNPSYYYMFFWYASGDSITWKGSPSTSSYPNGSPLAANGTSLGALNSGDFYFSAGNPAGDPTSDISLSIKFPTNSSSTFTHDFTSWQYVATSTASENRYLQFQFLWGTSSTTFGNTDNSIVYGFAPGATHYLSLSKSAALATSTTYYAKLCAFSNQTSGDLTIGELAACTDTITFKTGVSAAVINTDQNLPNPDVGLGNMNERRDCSVYPLTDTYAGIPFLSGDFLDGVYCRTENNLKDFGASLGQFGSDTVTGLTEIVKGIFPINIISHVNADIQAAQATTTDVKVTLSHSEFPIVQGNMTLFSSSTGAWVEQKSHVDFRSLFDKVAYLFTGLGILAVSYAIIHKSHRAATT